MNGLLRKHIVKSMIAKEFRQILRDPRMRGILFGTPFMMLIIFGYAVNTDVKEVRLAVQDDDKSAMSREVVERITSSGYFVLSHYIESAKELEPLMNSGVAEAYIHIPRGMSWTIKSGGSSQLQVIVDGSDSNRAAVVSAYLNEIVSGIFMHRYMKRIKLLALMRVSSGQGAPTGASAAVVKKGIELKERAFFNPELSSRNFFLPGVIGLLISLITIMLTSMSIVKERETGTFEQIIVSPIRPMEYIIGKTIPFTVIGFIDMCIVSVLAIGWFGVPFNGNFAFLLAGGLCYILSTLAVGLFISTISRTQQQAMLSFFLFFVPAILFSGFVFPIYSMPEPIQVIAYANPLMYFIIIIRGVFLKGVGIDILWKELLALFVIGLALLLYCSRRLSRRFE